MRQSQQRYSKINSNAMYFIQLQKMLDNYVYA